MNPKIFSYMKCENFETSCLQNKIEKKIMSHSHKWKQNLVFENRECVNSVRARE